ncbi:outer membrane beta-barrel protein [Pseudoalteromonas rubra]|uniref:Outer membrane protein beta-barrel domain-containing protein n=1 Tax=Pseudoalteromonas rubra TaxID=43658 RepID=A0A0F4QN93_9GAMM|nr:outer membrane beta-barrel protein [Pseudoalteromonas rubra]KJZ08735.1 hypothetical protein TW77_11595 [Pseudoalteromonas rubra]
MKQLSWVAGLAAVLAGAPAMAHSINFDKVEVGYKRFKVSEDMDLEPFNMDTLTGVNLSLSKRFDNYYVEGNYYNVDDEQTSSKRLSDVADISVNLELEIVQFTVGMGYIWELDDTALFDVSLHAGRVELKGSGDYAITQLGEIRHSEQGSDSDDDNIYRLRGQYQTRVMNDIELRAGLGFEKSSGEDSDSNPLFFVGAGYHFNAMFSVNTEYRHVDDYKTLDVNFRYSF